MAWTTPKTDWSNGELFTVTDANRIVNNLLFLYPSSVLSLLTGNDILAKANFDTLTNELSLLAVTCGLEPEPIGWDGTADCINAIEQTELDLYSRLSLVTSNRVARIYSGEYITGDIQNLRG